MPRVLELQIQALDGGHNVACEKVSQPLRRCVFCPPPRPSPSYERLLDRWIHTARSTLACCHFHVCCLDCIPLQKMSHLEAIRSSCIVPLSCLERRTRDRGSCNGDVRTGFGSRRDPVESASSLHEQVLEAYSKNGAHGESHAIVHRTKRNRETNTTGNSVHSINFWVDSKQNLHGFGGQ